MSWRLTKQALLHPNHEDGDALRDHSQRATWLGERVPLDLGLLKEMVSRRPKEAVNGVFPHN